MKSFHLCWGSRQADGSEVWTGRQRPIVSVFGSPVDSSPFSLTIRVGMGGKSEEAMENDALRQGAIKSSGLEREPMPPPPSCGPSWQGVVPPPWESDYFSFADPKCRR
jgi:hypothetical protein